MTTFTLKIWYAATAEDDPPQVHEALTADQMEQGSGAFIRDMLHLEGRGVRRLTVEVES